MYEDLREHLKGQIAYHRANCRVYMRNSVGIGEHPDIVGAIDEQLDKLTAAEEKLQAVQEHFVPDRVV